MSRDTVVLSGGVDSTVTLARAMREGGRVQAITFDYGQRHAREIQAARDVADHYGVPHQVIQVPPGVLTGSSLTGDGDLPTGEYGRETMSSTVVHGRNLLFASLALSYAGPGSVVWFGVHSGDHHLYPDCRPEFWVDLYRLARDTYDVHLRAPFVLANKADIVREGLALDAPLHLTWSCYAGGERPCGECGTCLERAEAFREAGRQ